MKKTIRLILSVLLIVGLALTVVSCRSAAYWQEQDRETTGEQVKIDTVNGSEKYIVYAALDAEGHLIAATDDETEAAAYAVVGYTGLVAELTVPATYTDTAIYEAEEGDDHSLPVTKVLVASPYSSYKVSRNGAAYTGDDARLTNNTVVKNILFGSNVSFVGGGVCAGMVNLQKLVFNCETAVTLGVNSFAATPSLTRVEFACAMENVSRTGCGFASSGVSYSYGASEEVPEEEED